MKGYIHSKMGAALLVDQRDFCYWVARKAENGKVFWVCCRKKSGCRARAVTFKNKITKISGKHNHPASPVKTRNPGKPVKTRNPGKTVKIRNPGKPVAKPGETVSGKTRTSSSIPNPGSVASGKETMNPKKRYLATLEKK